MYNVILQIFHQNGDQIIFLKGKHPFTKINILSNRINCESSDNPFDYTFRHNRTQSYDNMIAYEIHITQEVGENRPNKKKEDTYTEVSESRGHNGRKTDKWRASGPDVNRGQR